jgi:hypothetical protein
MIGGKCSSSAAVVGPIQPLYSTFLAGQLVDVAAGRDWRQGGGMVEAQRQRTGSHWPGSITLLALKHSRSPGLSLAASARVTARHVGYHKPSTPYRTSVLDTDGPPSCPPSEGSFSSIRPTHRAWHACCVARTIVPLVHRVGTEVVLFVGERTFSTPRLP